MGLLLSATHRHPSVLLILAGLVALLTALLLTGAADPQGVAAQVSPLSPLPVATPQPALLATDMPSPLSTAENGQSSSTDVRAAVDTSPAQAERPLIPLGAPAQTQPSMILVGALLVGLVVFVVVILVRRRE